MWIFAVDIVHLFVVDIMQTVKINTGAYFGDFTVCVFSYTTAVTINKRGCFFAQLFVKRFVILAVFCVKSIVSTMSITTGKSMQMY